MEAKTSTPATPAKLKYEPPRLVELGSVRELTEKAAGSSDLHHGKKKRCS